MDMDPPPKDTHFEHTKVNSILYTCPFGRLVDGILLNPPLPCILRLESYTCIMEEVGRKRTTTPSTREAWKRRRKREEAAPNFGRPTTFGRPTCRTSDSQRTFELMTERLQMHRTSGRLRTSDVSDVRNPTDVRHPSSSSAKTPAARRQHFDYRTSEAQRTSDPSFRRPKPNGRPNLPVCSSGPWAMYPLPLPLDYKYPFTTSFLWLAKIRTKLERALLTYLPLGDLPPSRDLLLLRERGFFCG